MGDTTRVVLFLTTLLYVIGIILYTILYNIRIYDLLASALANLYYNTTAAAECNHIIITKCVSCIPNYYCW